MRRLEWYTGKKESTSNMLRRNQRGSIDYFLYGLALISVLAFAFFLVLALARSDEPIVTSSTIERQQTESRQSTVSPPNDWHTYINEENQYSFSYPKEWGAVDLTTTGTAKQPNYEYRFTSNEAVVVSQRHAQSEEPVHSQDYTVYNRFLLGDTNVTFCGTETCLKSVAVPTSEASIYTNQALNDAIELNVIDGTTLRLIHVINTAYGDWPGIVVSTLLDEGIDPSQPKSEIVSEAVTGNYVKNEQSRQFADYIQ